VVVVLALLLSSLFYGFFSAIARRTEYRYYRSRRIAAFAAKAFLKVKGIHIIGVTDINESSSRKMAEEFNAEVYSGVEDLVKNEKIDLVYIGTPPYLHYQQSKLHCMQVNMSFVKNQLPCTLLKQQN
jgi:hypothetical protein